MKRSLLLLALPAALMLGGCAEAPTEPSFEPAVVRATVLHASAGSRFLMSPSFGMTEAWGGPARLEAGLGALVIDFESLASPGGDFTFVWTYSEDGFTLVNQTDPTFEQAFGSPQTDNADFYEGSATLINNLPKTVTLLTKDDGDTFTVLSIDLAELRALGLAPRSVPFTGTRADGSTVSVTFTTDGVAGLETFTFDGFTDLTSLSWVQLSPYHQFDNITISMGPVELPGAPDPESKDACKKGGWEAFGFKNQGQCVRFVETGKDSR